MAPPVTPLHERFHRYYERGDGCWLWIAETDRKGYGVLRYGPKHRSKIAAHRFAWVLARGPIPDGTMVCHSCDVRQCVNPAHLFLGDAATNMHDMWRKGRGKLIHRRGSEVPNAKLTDVQVREIRRKHAAGASIRGLAREYGLSNRPMWLIVHRQAWTHVTDLLEGA